MAQLQRRADERGGQRVPAASACVGADDRNYASGRSLGARGRRLRSARGSRRRCAISTARRMHGDCCRSAKRRSRPGAARNTRRCSAEDATCSADGPNVVDLRSAAAEAARLGAGVGHCGSARSHELRRPLSEHTTQTLHRAGARRGSRRDLQPDRQQGAAHSGHRASSPHDAAQRRERRHDLLQPGVSHELLGPSRPAASASTF